MPPFREMLSAAVLSFLAVGQAQELFVPPQVITALKRGHPDTALVADGRAAALIVHPDDPGYADLAARVAAAVEAASGVALPVRPAGQLTAADREQHLVCLGRMNNNPLAQELYLWRYVAADDWFPGPGGYDVRTVHDPWGNGRNVIMLGGSDLEGVTEAVTQFLDRLPRGASPVIPRTTRVRFKGMENLDAFTPAALERYQREFIDLKALPYQAERLLVDCAEMHILTGRDEYAEAYGRMLRRWMDEYVRWTPERQITTPKYIIPEMMLTFDQMEESPLLPDALKLEMTNLLYDYASRLGVHSRITDLRPGVLSGVGLHDVSESVAFAARYFSTYYPGADLDRLQRGLAQVRVGQATMANSNGVIDNNGGYTPYYAQAAMRLALALGDHAFFESGAARRWIEYSMLVTDSWASSFYGYNAGFAMAAWYYQDPAMVWFNNWRSGRSDYTPEMTATEFRRWVWTYLPRLPGQAPSDQAGLRFMRLHPTNYDQLKGMGKAIHVPRERSFHQLAMRSGLGRSDQYLRLDGINDGIEGGGDGNAIAWLTDGRPWLTATGKWGGGRTMKWYNTALVLRDGQMADRLVALCDLEVASDLPSSAFVRSVMREYNGLDWARSIAWIKGRYWVVFDQFQAREPGDYSVMCQWFHGARQVDEQCRAIQASGDHTLVLQAAGGVRPLVTFLDDGRPIVRQSVHAELPAGRGLTMAHLLYAHPKDQDHPYAVRRLATGRVLVSEPERQVLIGLATLGAPAAPLFPEGPLEVACALYALSDHDLALAALTRLGTADAQGVLLEADRPLDGHLDAGGGVLTLVAAEPTRLRLRGLRLSDGRLTAADPEVVQEVALTAGRHQAAFAAGQDGPLAGLTAAARAALESAAGATAVEAVESARELPRRLVPCWQFSLPDGDAAAVRVVRAADLDGDGQAEVVVGSADGRVLCLTAEGRERWSLRLTKHPEQPSSRGQDKAGINDIAVADFGAGARILVASDSQYLHCLDADGRELWKFTGAGLRCTNQAAGTYGTGRYVEGDGEMMAVHIADLDGDGTRRILAGSKTFMHGGRRVFGTLWCLDAAGQLLWHLYQSAGTVTSVATFAPNGDGPRRIAFGSGGGTYGVGSYVCDNRGGSVVYHASGYGEKVVAVGRIGPDRGLGVVRLERRDGTLIAYDAAEPHAERWTFRAGGLDAAGPVLADVNGDGQDEILVGSDGGSLFCLNDRERPLTWRCNLGEPVCALAAGEFEPGRAGILAGSSPGGVTAVSGDGTPLARADVGAPVTCVAVLALAPQQPAVAVAGTSAGRLTVFRLE